MCTCETGAASTATPTESTGRTYTVTGMTCQPCATKVTAAVEQVDGVTAVTVDLAAGRIAVAGTATDSAIHSAVTGAGYEIATI
jgi:copper chaperone CopZ